MIGPSTLLLRLSELTPINALIVGEIVLVVLG
jgi:hypothetical protein